MSKGTEVILKNISPGWRGVHVDGGELVMFDPGETRPVTLNDVELRDALASGNFEAGDPLDHDGDGTKGGSLPAEPVSLSGKNKAQLLEIAAAESVTVADDATNAQIVEAIEAGRAE